MLFSEVMGCCKTSNPLKHILHLLYTFYIYSHQKIQKSVLNKQ